MITACLWCFQVAQNAEDSGQQLLHPLLCVEGQRSRTALQHSNDVTVDTISNMCADWYENLARCFLLHSIASGLVWLAMLLLMQTVDANC